MADNVRDQYEDNCHWIKEAGRNKLVVGSQARILYSDRDGRIALALAFNKAVADGKLHVNVVNILPQQSLSNMYNRVQWY